MFSEKMGEGGGGGTTYVGLVRQTYRQTNK